YDRVRAVKMQSRLFAHAVTLTRYPVEKAKPDETRLTEYTDANFPVLKQALLSKAPIYPELEKLLLTHGLTKLREILGADDALVKKVLGASSPAEVAARLIDGTKLVDADERRRLFEGGQAAIDASTDPLIVFAKLIDEDLRAIRKDVEDN